MKIKKSKKILSASMLLLESKFQWDFNMTLKGFLNYSLRTKLSKELVPLIEMVS